MDSYTMSYTQLIPVMVNAMQELSETIDGLKEENDQLKKRLEQLEND